MQAPPQQPLNTPLEQLPPQIRPENVSMLIPNVQLDGFNVAFAGIYLSKEHHEIDQLPITTIFVRYSEDPFGHSSNQPSLSIDDSFEIEEVEGQTCVYWIPDIYLEIDADLSPSEYIRRKRELINRYRIRVGVLSESYAFTKNVIDDDLRLHLFMIETVIARGNLELIEEIMDRIETPNPIMAFDFDGLANRIRLREDQLRIISEAVES